jgi:electron transfer flavoprotein beta subunit
MEAPAPLLRVVAMKLPEKRKAAKIIDAATPQAKAAELVRILHEEAKVI